MIRDAIRRRRDGGREALVASLEDLAERLAFEEQARAAFIGKVSHELRTPLTVIKGYVYTLQRAEADSAKAAKLEVIDGECERLSYMIESLLELSRVRSGHVRVCDTSFPLRACVEEVAERLRAVAAHRDVEIHVSWDCADVAVAGDENRLRQVFANLIGNAIKYAPPGTEVAVAAEAKDGSVAVCVEDRGRGIAEADLPFVFDEFFQAPERSEPGAGLGLAIARELTEAHAGRIDVTSRVGEGARFTVTLPTVEDEL
jgi:two-component system, OmpR family, phosphate regulon sensor histidine kinase PhoR